MPSVTHLVVSGNFAGTERYVCQLASASAGRGWQVSVIGGEPARMRAELTAGVTWLPGATPAQAVGSLYRLGRQDVCHAHLTLAETVASVLRLRHRGRLISTRHIAATRGSTRIGRLVAPWIGHSVDQEIAISRFVADHIGVPGAVTIHNGVPHSPSLWDPQSRIVLLVQRLEPEKHTALALKAWRLSGLAVEGWRMRIVGDGSERAQLESLVESNPLAGVEFLGARTDVPRLMAEAGIVLATAPLEPLGLSVLEAMAAGVPVVASLGGGHLETLAPQAGINGFAPADAVDAAGCLARLARDEDLRRELSVLGRERQVAAFTLDRMVEEVHQQYERC